MLLASAILLFVKAGNGLIGLPTPAATSRSLVIRTEPPELSIYHPPTLVSPNSTMLQGLPLAENQPIHLFVKNITLQHTASVRRAEEAAKTTPAPSGECSAATFGYSKKLVPLLLKFWSRSTLSRKLGLVRQEWIQGTLYLSNPARWKNRHRDLDSTSFLSESTRASVYQIVRKVQKQMRAQRNLRGHALPIYDDDDPYYYLVELHFFQVPPYQNRNDSDSGQGITPSLANATEFVPDSVTAVLLRKRNHLCQGEATKSSGLELLQRPQPAESLGAPLIYTKEDIDTDYDTLGAPHGRILKLIKKIKKKIKKGKKKGKKKKKNKDEHSSEEHQQGQHFHGPPPAVSVPAPFQQHPIQTGWNSWLPQQQSPNTFFDSIPHEIAGWVGGSISAGGWDQGGWHELEFLPGEVLQKIVTALGVMAIVIGPVLVLAGLCWLVTGHKSSTPSAFIFNGRSTPDRSVEPSMAMLSFDNDRYHTLEEIAV